MSRAPPPPLKPKREDKIKFVPLPGSSVPQPPPPPQSSSNAKGNDIIKYVPLYWALVKGELERVEAFLERDPDAILANISTKGEKPIHIAVSHGHQELVELLLERADATSLSWRLGVLQDDYKDTALHVAARGGNKRMAEALVSMSVTKRNEDQQSPLTLAAIYGNKGILELLRPRPLLTNEDNNQYWYIRRSLILPGNLGNGILLMELIESENYDLALKHWERREYSAELVHRHLKQNLHKIAKKVFVISSENQLGDFKSQMYSWMYRCIDMPPDSILHNTSDVENQREDSKSSPHSRFKDRVQSTVLQIVKELMSTVAKVTGIEKGILNMKKNNIQARELLTKMCSPVWTFDSGFFEVYFEAIKVAIKCGNVKFVEEVLRSNPTLLWGDKKGRTIFHIALAFRQEKIWNLIYGLTTEQRNKIIGSLLDSNSMLHIAAYPLVVPNEDSKKEDEEQQLRKVFNKAPGAAMKLQKELQWYKEVERMVPSSYKFLANKNGETPRDLFSKSHSELVEGGEKWMRQTATSCTIVATLIVTVMFAAAFTLPGGTDENSGNPKFLGRNSFWVFVISDALSLFSSVTAVLMFLSILTSRFEEDDFLKTLPTKMIIGLAALFISIATMMVAFGFTLVMVLGEQISWSAAVATITVFGSVPAFLFALLQLPLFAKMVSSTCGCGLFDRKTKCSFFKDPNVYVPPKYGDNMQ